MATCIDKETGKRVPCGEPYECLGTYDSDDSECRLGCDRRRYCRQKTRRSK